MKRGLTLKTMLIATLCCILLSAYDLLFDGGWTSPREFKTLLYWLIVLIGWAVYAWEHFQKK